MSTPRTFGFVLVVAAVFAVIGGLVGGLIGGALDQIGTTYYRGTFRGPMPVPALFRLGLVLGATQALIVGLLVGSFVIRVVAESRLHPLDRVGYPGPIAWVWPSLVSLGILALLALGGTIVFIVGGVAGHQSVYMADTRSKLERLEPILSEPPYSRLSTLISSAAQVSLSGSVETDQQRQELRKRLSCLFGDEEADFMCSQVRVVRHLQAIRE